MGLRACVSLASLRVTTRTALLIELIPVGIDLNGPLLNLKGAARMQRLLGSISIFAEVYCGPQRLKPHSFLLFRHG
jgi:hypothetical protein